MEKINETVKKIFLNGFKKRTTNRKVGVEEELLLAKKDGEIGNTEDFFQMMSKRGWETIIEEGKIKGFKDPRSGWVLVSDAGRGTLEIISLPENDLHKVNHFYNQLMHAIKYCACESGQYLLGLGIQPFCRLGTLEERNRLWQETRRYHVLREKLSPGVDVATLTAASQTHVEVARKEAFRAFLVLNALSGPMIALAANSTVWQGVPDKRVAVRADSWKNFAQGRSGIPQSFEHFEDMIHYILSLPYYLSSNGESFAKIFSNKDEEEISSAFLFQESTCWWDSRLRSAYGTIEIRPCCQQPPWLSSLGLHALHLGLVENLEEAYRFVSRHPWSYWEYFREEAIRGAGCFSSEITRAMIKIAIDGLKKRGKQEEVYLEEFLLRKSIEPSPWKLARNLFQDKEKLLRKFSF